MRFLITVLVVLFFASFAFPESGSGINLMSAYTVNDEIYVNVLGQPEGKPITSGHPDYKPSWSVDGKWIVFFRITANNGPDISRWKTAICIVHPDGTDFRQITSGTFTDYNPTWSREGSNTILINRYDNIKKKCFIYRTTVDSKPGEEVLISDPAYSEYANTAMKDGRILITSGRGAGSSVAYALSGSPSKSGYFEPPFVYALTAQPGKIGIYEQVRFQHKLEALPSRMTLSGSEKGVTYEVDGSWGNFGYAGHPLVAADFDAKTLTVSNELVFCRTRSDVCSIYPTFTKDEKGLVYCSNPNGKFQFYLYNREDKTTKRVSQNGGADYKYFCGENVPK